MARFRLLTLLSGCRPEEAPLVRRLWLLAFCVGTSASLFRNAAQSLFLGTRDLDALLLAWLGSAALSGLVLASFGHLQSRRAGSDDRLTPCTILLGAFLVVMALVRLALLFGLNDAGVLAGGYVAEITYLLGALAFWPIATGLLDIRQGRRVFGFLATGEALAEILGGLAIPLVVHVLGVVALLDAAIVALALALVIARQTLRAHAPTSTTFRPAGSSPRRTSAWAASSAAPTCA
jgi:hypothetical protein